MAGIYIDCSSREIILIIRPKMRPIVTRVLVRSVCLSVCWTQSKTLQNHGTDRPVVLDMGSVGTVTRCLHFTAGCASDLVVKFELGGLVICKKKFQVIIL